MANLARPGKNESLSPQEWLVVAAMVKKDYPDMEYNTLANAIENGVKGLYNSDSEAYLPINTRTIYAWIRVQLAEEKSRPKDGLEYLAQMREKGLLPNWQTTEK